MSSRPPLPTKYANPHVKTALETGNIPPVKYQILSCRGQDILVGRMKIETPTQLGHAFILRRYDTGAISLTTMFRAAFPNASDIDESTEVQWVKENFDLSGTNGNSRETHITRLAGTWISPDTALELGMAYKLGELIISVVDAKPDPDANYRRSGKGTGTNGTPTKPPSTTTAKPNFVKAESPVALNPSTKRRKEASPAPTSASESNSQVEVKVEKKEKVISTPIRRSTRTTKSPAPSSKPKSSSSTSSTSPVATRTKRITRREVKEEVTPSDETIVEDEAEAIEDVAGEELHKQDIAEQKALIEDLKAKRDAELRKSDGEVDEADKLAAKRAREDVEEEEKLKFNFKEPEVGERAIATNRRVPGYYERLPPERKGLAVGVAAFVFGVGAMFLPTLLS